MLFITYDIIDGANFSTPVQSVIHFRIISTSMYPNMHTRNTTWGMNSK